MEISINIPCLIAGLALGIIPTFTIMYFRLKILSEINSLNISQHSKEKESFGVLNKQAEANYKQKIEILESEIEKINTEYSSLKEIQKEKIDQAKEDLTTQHKKDIESIAMLNKQVESSYNQKIVSLEAEINKQSISSAQDKDKLNIELSLLKESHKEEIKQAKEELSIVTYPYEEQRGEDGLFSDDRSAEIGYKFQLFVRGIPCFEAYKIPVEKLYKKEVSLEKIKNVTNEVVNLLESFAKKHPAIAVADKFAKIKKS